MTYSTGHFRGSGGLELFRQSWMPDGPARAALIVVHGIGEHSGRYMNLVDHLVPLGYSLHSFDLRGHGRSPGQRGHINSWSEFRDDLAAFFETVAPESSGLPRFLLGHSMGGVIVLDYCLRKQPQLEGLICSAPAIGDIGVPAALWFLAKILDRLWPRFSLGTQLQLKYISRDPDLLRETLNDPLCSRKASARFGMQIKQTVEWIQAHADDICLPLFMVHGTADRIADPEGSRKFIRNISYPDAELREYDGGYHELHNDIIKEQLLTNLEQWLEKHL